MKRKKYNGVELYALVTQLLILLVVLTVGGFLLGKFVFFKTTLAGGIMSVTGAICGIIYFIVEMLKIGKTNEQRNERD